MDVNTERDLEQELVQNELIREKCRDGSYAQHLYAALCNTRWQPTEMWPILKEQWWSCSWRHAGSIVAGIRNSLDPDLGETYIDWYCSGMWTPTSADMAAPVTEGTVTEEISRDLAALGWKHDSQ
jgi:hypothetical protein